MTRKFTFTTTRRIVIEQECTFSLDLPDYVTPPTAEALANDYLQMNVDLLRWKTTEQLDPTTATCGLDSPTLLGEPPLPLPPEDIIPNGIKPQRTTPTPTPKTYDENGRPL